MTKAKVIKTHTVNGTAGYSDLTKCRSAFSAFTIASLIALGFVNMSVKGTFTRGRRKYNPGALRAVTGPTMVNHWTNKGRIDPDEGITVDGLNECARRVDDPKYGYRTTRENVAAMLTGIQSGGKVKVDGHIFDLRDKAKKAKAAKPNPEMGKGLFDD